MEADWTGQLPARSASPNTPTLREDERQASNPNGSASSDSMSRLPLLEVDINITPTHTERIQIFSGDQIDGEDGIAKRFCQQHGLGESMEQQLVRVLAEQVQEAKEQIEMETIDEDQSGA